MKFKSYLLQSLVLFLLLSCRNEPRNNDSIPNTSVSVENKIDKRDFVEFIKRFSTDSLFQQLSIKYPVKITQYQLDFDTDTIMYRSNGELEMMDLRENKNVHNEWSQHIVVESNTAATVEARGLENGIMVDYIFKKDKGKWMLVEIRDSST